MIFDGNAAKQTYVDYYNGVGCLEDLLGYCQPLVEAIATDLSTSSRYREDLIQEGYVKLLKLFNNYKFKPNGNKSGGDFHSWLSFSLRNCMVDYLRKQRDHDDFPEDILYHPNVVYDNSHEVSQWALARFPQLPEELVKDAAHYVYHSLQEDVFKKSVGIISTLNVVYDLDTNFSRLFYHSCRIFESAGDLYKDDALLLAAVDTYSETLLPELVLMTGSQLAASIILTFKSCKLQF